MFGVEGVSAETAQAAAIGALKKLLDGRKSAHAARTRRARTSRHRVISGSSSERKGARLLVCTRK